MLQVVFMSLVARRGLIAFPRRCLATGVGAKPAWRAVSASCAFCVAGCGSLVNAALTNLCRRGLRRMLVRLTRIHPRAAELTGSPSNAYSVALHGCRAQELQADTSGLRADVPEAICPRLARRQRLGHNLLPQFGSRRQLLARVWSEVQFVVEGFGEGLSACRWSWRWFVRASKVLSRCRWSGRRFLRASKVSPRVATCVGGLVAVSFQLPRWAKKCSNPC